MIRRQLTDSWLDQPKLDYVLVMLVAGGLGLLDPRTLLPVASRPTFYQTLAAVSGVLLSVGTITITVLFAVAPTERLERVLDVIGPRLRSLVMSSLSGLVVTTAGFLAVFLLDSQAGRVRIMAVSSLVILMMLRFGRLWWLLNAVLAVLTIHAVEPPATTWQPPTLKRGDYQLPRRRPPTQSPRSEAP